MSLEIDCPDFGGRKPGGEGLAGKKKRVARLGLGYPVLEACYAEMPLIEIQNPTADAWIGSVEFFADGTCDFLEALPGPNCTTGCSEGWCRGKLHGDACGPVVADGSGDGFEYSAVACLNGARCTISHAPTPAPSPSQTGASTTAAPDPAASGRCDDWCLAEYRNDDGTVSGDMCGMTDCSGCAAC